VEVDPRIELAARLIRELGAMRGVEELRERYERRLLNGSIVVLARLLVRRGVVIDALGRARQLLDRLEKLVGLRRSEGGLAVALGGKSRRSLGTRAEQGCGALGNELDSV
jgi:hypothetical protein